MGDPSYFGLLGGLLAQQQQANQWAQLQPAWTGSSANNLSYVVNVAPVEALAPAAPHEETALEWLDRRVAEVSLAL